jgi:phage-related protein
MKWSIKTLNAVVDAELEGLPADMLARFHHISRLIEEFGLESVREPHVKHLQGSLWEMRMKGKDGISRALYVTAVAKESLSSGCSLRKRRRARAVRSSWP